MFPARSLFNAPLGVNLMSSSKHWMTISPGGVFGQDLTCREDHANHVKAWSLDERVGYGRRQFARQWLHVHHIARLCVRNRHKCLCISIFEIVDRQKASSPIKQLFDEVQRGSPSNAPPRIRQRDMLRANGGTVLSIATLLDASFGGHCV